MCEFKKIFALDDRSRDYLSKNRIAITLKIRLSKKWFPYFRKRMNCDTQPCHPALFLIPNCNWCDSKELLIYRVKTFVWNDLRSCEFGEMIAVTLDMFFFAMLVDFDHVVFGVDVVAIVASPTVSCIYKTRIIPFEKNILLIWLHDFLFNFCLFTTVETK